MHRLLLMTLALLLSTAPLTTPVAARPGADAHPGPFYDSPVALPQTHGALMRKRRYVGPLKVRGAINKKVLYSQVGVDGEMLATSGFVSVPRRRPPVGGFPIVTWGHGTTGAADRCAPSVEASRSLRTNPANDLIQDWVDRGWAVVRTDYEGLGTRGLHPYLVGVSEGRAMMDAVRAAREAFPSISDRVAIAGSSQGGHAALWAAEVAPDYTPDLTVTSTTAFAPPSHLSSQLTAARALPVTNLTATLALILRGADVADPSLRVRRVLTDRAATLWPRQRFECQQQMASADAYGGVPANQLIRPTADVSAILEVIDANGAESLAPPGPVLVLQGLRDMTVMPPTSAALVTRYTARGVDVTYRTYPDAAHGTVVADGGADATAFIATHLEGQRS